VPLVALALLLPGAAAGCGHDWSMPGPPDSGWQDCSSLALNVVTLRKAAKNCVAATLCTLITDECGCQSGVSGDQEAVASYKEAIDDLQAAFCTPLGCNGCGDGGPSVCSDYHASDDEFYCLP
jgi:hypothetical protein